jgi:hypothetical protein
MPESVTKMSVEGSPMVCRQARSIDMPEAISSARTMVATSGMNE